MTVSRGNAVRAAVLSLLALVWIGSAEAAGEVRMRAEMGLGTVVRGGAWAPVVVELENPGSPVRGSVVLRFSDQSLAKGASRMPVELATGAKKRVTVYGRPRAGPQRLEVALEDERGRILAGPTELLVQAADEGVVFVGLVSMGSGGDPGLRPLIDSKTRVVPLDAEQLPDLWPALEVFDALVLRDPDVARLGPARIDALKLWVSAGGTLAVTGGEKWRAMDDPTFTEMLPVRVQGVRTLAASDLPFPFSSHAGDLAVAVAAPLRGEVRVSGAGGEPIVADGRYGLGRVVFLAADPGDLAGVRIEEKAALWEAVLQIPPVPLEDPNAPNYYNAGNNSAEQFIQQELSRIPPLKPPSVLLVTILIAFYVLVVGPGDYFVLKKLGKLHWTWVTYPAAIAVFSGLIYFYAKVTRSSDMMIRTISLVDSPAEPPGAASPVRVFGGVYSPRAGRYVVSIRRPDALAASFAEKNPYGMASKGAGEFVYTGGKNPSLRLSIPIWSMAGVEMATSTGEPPPFLVEAVAPGKVRITNTGSATLEYVGLLVGDKVIDGGPLAPGGDVTISNGASGHKLANLPEQMSAAMWGENRGKEDLPRIVRVFAYATDPPHSTGSGADYYLPSSSRREEPLQRPKEDHGQPMVFVMARDTELPIGLSGTGAAGSGLTVWRRPVPGARVSRPRPENRREHFEEHP